MSSNIAGSEEKPKITIKDLNTENPRWCAGCGDFGVLMAVKRFMVDEQLQQHTTVNISGIGCSGRSSFYLNTYSAHIIHGRTVPFALGLALTRPELDLIIHSGDGDSMSIGGNHLMHGINKNFNCTYILYDNEIYALTKKQTSPTTSAGYKTNTQPYGTVLDPLIPVQFALGVGASFVAGTADWLADHMVQTLDAAYHHKGFSFVHVAQRCPHFYPENFDSKSHQWFSFISHENGINPDKRLADKAEVIQHDPSDRIKAFELAGSKRHHFGLFYKNSEKPRYDEILQRQTREMKQKDRKSILDPYKI